MKRLLLLGIVISGTVLAASVEIRPAKELVLTHLSVVEDDRAEGDGPWSFRGVLRQASPPGANIPRTIERWLSSWNTVTQLNGYPVAPRDAGVLPLNQSPFLLAAIVFRLDLDVPEGRFVFGALDRFTGEPLPFTAIFECALPFDAELPSLAHWAAAIHALSTIPFGASFNVALERLTRRFAPHLRQVRTNDFAFDFLWELREFRMDRNGSLEPHPLVQTPDLSFDTDHGAYLADWVAEHGSTAKLPPWMLAGAGLVPNEGFRWLTRTSLPEPLRAEFSMNTCNGCHAGESQTRFVHIASRRPGNEPERSRFLETDLGRRAELLRQLLEKPAAARPRYPFVH